MPKHRGWFPILAPCIASAAVMLAGCAPSDYADTTADRPATVEAAPESEGVTGGADPTAVSGTAHQDTTGTIHHPRADGNTGRAPERTATTTEAQTAAEGRTIR